MADTQYLDGLLNQFLAKFPLESLQTMSLEQYTDVVEKGKTNDSFTYWVESKTRELGSIKGGSSEKFNIYKYNKTPTSKYFLHDNTYTWYARLGQTKDEAWEKTRGIIYEVAKLASEKKFSEIDKIDELWPGYKWKIAFLYSNKTILNTFKLEAIKYVAKTYGKDFGKSQNFAEIYEFLLSQKSENENFWDFGESIWKKWNDSGEDMEEEKKLTVEDYTNLLLNTHNLILHGAPRTGKTHLAKEIAKEMGCSDDEIGFVQFHPSYDYTDFVEGLRPVRDENGEVNFKRMDGVFKKFCIKSLQTNDFYSDQNIFDNLYEYLCNEIALSENEYIEIPLLYGKGILKLGFNETGTGLMSFNGTKKYFTKEQLYNVYLGKSGVPSGGHDTYRKAIITYLKNHESEIYISLFEKKNSIFSIVGDNGQEIKIEIESDGYKILSDDRNITVNRSDIFDYWDNQDNYKQKTNNNYSYTYSIGDYILSTLTRKENNNRKFVFIIDEINRGELSKIFGELFYSIDPGYRINVPKLDKQNLPVTIKTQYSNMQDGPNEFDVLLNEQEDFGHFFIPDNVYIIGTMNDIDRSVECMDFAFRRRFTFKEITAKDTQEEILSEFDDEIRKEAIQRMDSLNNAIDGIDGLSSAYHIGGAYFLKLKDLDDDFEALWDYHLEGLLREYLRGMEDAEELLEDLHDAYNLKNQE